MRYDYHVIYNKDKGNGQRKTFPVPKPLFRFLTPASLSLSTSSAASANIGHAFIYVASRYREQRGEKNDDACHPGLQAHDIPLAKPPQT